MCVYQVLIMWWLLLCVGSSGWLKRAVPSPGLTAARSVTRESWSEQSSPHSPSSEKKREHDVNIPVPFVNIVSYHTSCVSSHNTVFVQALAPLIANEK